jgi:hypothetical protein
MRFCLLAVSLFVAGCGSAHLKAGKKCLESGNLPLAVEYLDQGVVAEPGNTEMRQLGIVARQIYEHALRQEIDRLVGSKRFLLALGRLVELEEIARRAEKLSMPADLVPEVEREKAGVARQAVEQLGRAMEKRSGRSIAVKADLATCRQLLALVENDESVKRTCDRLRARFQLLAVLEEAKGTLAVTKDLFPVIKKLLIEKNPELIGIVDRASGKHTALMQLWVGEPVVQDIPFRMTRRQAFHRWIPKRDRRGRQLEEIVVIQPTAEEYANAQKVGLPPPEPKKVKKKVWELISGEFRVFASERNVSLPYSVTIQDLRSKTLAAVFSGVVSSASESSYYEYSGDPRGEDRAPVRCRGRGCAPALTSANDLAFRALAQIPGRVVNTTLERVE